MFVTFVVAYAGTSRWYGYTGWRNNWSDGAPANSRCPSVQKDTGTVMMTSAWLHPWLAVRV